MEEKIPGMIVRQLLPGSPAIKAGIKPGDRLIAIDGQPINNAQDYMDATCNKVASRQIDVIRGNQFLTFTVVYENVPPLTPQEAVELLERDKNGERS